MNSQPSPKDDRGKTAPGPRGNFLLGSLRAYGADPLGFTRDVARDYGDVARIRNAHITSYLVSHPDGVQRVLHDHHRNYTRSGSFIWDKVSIALGDSLLTSDGDDWRPRRRLMQPVFHHRHVTGFGALITKETLAMLEPWQPLAAQGRAFDLAAEMINLTLHILLTCLFSAYEEKRLNAIVEATTIQNQDMMLRTSVPFYPPPFVPTRHNWRLRWAMHTLDQIMFDLIDHHRRNPAESGDLLSLLIESHDEETGRGMTDQQLRDELLSLFFAGHETTANTLAWMFYLLASHPEVVRRLQAEIEAQIGQRPPTMENLPDLPYCQNVISETLRLYPPSWITNRMALAEDEICGYRIPRGALITLSSYVTHRHPAFWEAPDSFDPDRFSAGRSQNRHRYAYFPFLSGPHLCIGKDFALLELQLILILVTQRFQLELVPGAAVVPEPLITLRPKGGLLMTVHGR